MKERIEERLGEIEAQYGFRIIYACESGSRAWGFASEDSDYDVYLGLCRKIWLGSLEQKEITAKKYLYVLRSLLSARYICENLSIAPVEFARTLNALQIDSEVGNAVDKMIDAKANQKEADLIPRHLVLDEFIEEERLAINDIVNQLPDEEGSVEELNQFFRRTIGFQG